MWSETLALRRVLHIRRRSSNGEVACPEVFLLIGIENSFNFSRISGIRVDLLRRSPEVVQRTVVARSVLEVVALNLVL